MIIMLNANALRWAALIASGRLALCLHIVGIERWISQKCAIILDDKSTLKKEKLILINLFLKKMLDDVIVMLWYDLL